MASFQKKQPKQEHFSIPNAERTAAREFTKKIHVPDPPQHMSEEVKVAGETFRVGVSHTTGRWMVVYFYRKIGDAWCIFGEFAFHGSDEGVKRQAGEFFLFLYSEATTKLKDFINERISCIGKPEVRKRKNLFKKK